MKVIASVDERKNKNESMWAAELAYQQGEKALMQEQSKEIALRHLFFGLYIASMISIVAWGIYFYRLYKIRQSPQTDNSLKISGSSIIHHYGIAPTPVRAGSPETAP